MNSYLSWRSKSMNALNAFILIVISLIMLFPFYYMIVTSFTSYAEFVQKELQLFPKTWVLDAYNYIFESKAFVRSIGVTVFVTIIGSLISLLLTSMMAYALSRQIWGQRFYLFLVLFTFVFGAGIIPTYLVVKATHLLNSYWALIIPGAINSFNLIVMRQFFMGIPQDLSEAAYMDGANDLQIFSRIIIPLSKPALAAFGLFYAVSNWNTYFSALIYISDPAKWTVQVILRQIVILEQASGTLSDGHLMGLAQNPPPAETIGMAAVLLATIPILLVYPFLQKHFAKGVMLGSVKG
ncbi:carbohydrate ABC transporter permease [Paenibacillus alginolyticus]|uniref:Carbohydrate ABC transporter permease n=1 Tax=Paenibacillus alginolyticus TaxID=59839 RepID=A0ABT4GDT4_9BACL|nr:carbohydrate ABC transporter permease [Paenibacillus alginolyticus]MCY9663832.1 carbohydrate ABC transporter permease [Paenibacillus alginolyticus]MCY9694343.1 carbohydrate ABC transporter permease [Paenibacillus alginolyticus]MEC0147512.1 carbohydrate ABC transporter permease [Paenibacillus alginolyticus]